MINWLKSLFRKKIQACNDNRMYEDIDDATFIAWFYKDTGIRPETGIVGNGGKRGYGVWL